MNQEFIIVLHMIVQVEYVLVSERRYLIYQPQGIVYVFRSVFRRERKVLSLSVTPYLRGFLVCTSWRVAIVLG